MGFKMPELYVVLSDRADPMIDGVLECGEYMLCEGRDELKKYLSNPTEGPHGEIEIYQLGKSLEFREINVFELVEK